jgi:hypothetical protein
MITDTEEWRALNNRASELYREDYPSGIWYYESEKVKESYRKEAEKLMEGQSNE